MRTMFSDTADVSNPAAIANLKLHRLGTLSLQEGYRLDCAGQLLSREQLVPEIGALMMAGFDTSSHTVAW